MTLRKGSLLEKNVENIFRTLEFNTETNVKKAGYEIDVIAEKNGFKIVCECKQYENTPLTIRNLIHQWSDKNLEIGADRVLLVLYGMVVKETDISLALSRNIILWDEKTLQEYTDLIIKDKEEAYRNLISELGLEIGKEPEPKDDKEVRKLRNISEAKKYIMLALMSGKKIDEIDNREDLYDSFILSLKSSLQTTLSVKPLSKNPEEDRKRYAELFSRAEREGRTNKEKWDIIKRIIKEDNTLFPPEKIKNAHLENIKRIEDFFESGKSFFNENDKTILRRKLIETSLEYSDDIYHQHSKRFLELEDERGNRTFLPTLVFMSKQNPNHKLAVSFEDDDFIFQLDKPLVSTDRIEKLDWIVEEPKDISTRHQGYSLSQPKSVDEFNLVETINWSIDDDINKASNYIETIFLDIFGEDKDFDIVLDGFYNEPVHKKSSMVLFWVYILIGIFTIRWLIGLIFFYLAYREYKKNKTKY